VVVRWRERLIFEGGGEGRPPILVDGDSVVATSPVELLLLAAATCAGADVVSLLEKQRVSLRALEIRMQGTRRDNQPRRYTAIHFHFTITASGVDEVKARRAIDLSLEKYCSIVASLAPDTNISYDLALR
jgi:putative redox protein